MTVKPTTLPVWATAGAIVEPSGGKKATGFVGGEQPPAEFFNYLLNLLYTWTQYLDRPDGFTLGQDLVDTEARALTARLTASPASNAVTGYTLLGDWGDARIWIGSTTKLGLVLTYNATRPADGTDKWAKITSNQPATALFIQRSRVVVCSMPLAQNTAWADDFVSGDGTTAGWGRSLDLPADPKQDTKAQSDVARYTQEVSNTSGVKRVLQLHFKYPSVGDVRLYYCTVASDGDSGAWEITLNAGYNNTADLWTYDRTFVAHKFIFSSTRLGVKFIIGGAAGSTFADSAWTATPVNFQWQVNSSGANKYDVGNGRFGFVGTLSATANDANPPSTSVVPANTMAAKNICKSWGNITEVVATGPVVNDGYNIASISRDTVNETISVVFATPMQNANYSLVVTGQRFTGGSYLLPNVLSQSTTGFTLIFMAIPLGAGPNQLVNLGVDAPVFSFQVFARQDT